MKWKFFALTLALSASMLLFATTARVAIAGGPTDADLTAAWCSRLGPTAGLTALQRFTTDYGWQHRLTTDEQWRDTYSARLNEFANLFGCGALLEQQSDNSAAATPFLRIMGPRLRWLEGD